MVKVRVTNGAELARMATRGEGAELEARFEAALARLAGTEGCFVAAVSGGADSVAAARLLAAGGRPFVVAHFDHRLRPDSGADAAFVRDMSYALGAPFKLGGADVGAVARAKSWNVEDAARRLRYAFLHRVLREAGGGGAIVVAHTADDQAETLLLQLLRGAAYPAGMAPRRGAVVRPLLDVRRAALRDYLNENAQAWREDASNEDTARSRAWLRHEVIPRLEERFPGAAERVARAAAELADARAALEEAGRARLGGFPVRTSALAEAPSAVRRAHLAAGLRGAGAPPSARLIDELEATALRSAAEGSRAAPWRRDAGRGVRATVAYGSLGFGAAAPGARGLGGQQAVESAEQLPPGVDPRVLRENAGLVLRGRRPGDRIRLPAGSKLVSDLLIDRKVPLADRDALRVLATGAEVLWIEGVAMAAGAGADASSADERFMRLALEEARRGRAAGEVPIGAVVVVNEEVVAAAHNRTESMHDPTAHAEVLALRAAAKARGDWRLRDATLYVTLEPCPMCLGAALQAQVGRLVFGASNVREGALGGVVDLASAGWKRVPDLRGGVEGRAASALLRAAFKETRAASGSREVPDDPHQDGTN